MTTPELLYSEQHRVEVEDGGIVYIFAPAVFYEPVGALPFFADGGSGIQIHTNAQYHIIDLRVEILSALDTGSQQATGRANLPSQNCHGLKIKNCVYRTAMTGRTPVSGTLLFPEPTP